MYNIETVESLHAYADRLHQDAARLNAAPRRTTMRQLVRRVRRSS